MSTSPRTGHVMPKRTSEVSQPGSPVKKPRLSSTEHIEVDPNTVEEPVDEDAREVSVAAQETVGGVNKGETKGGEADDKKERKGPPTHGGSIFGSFAEKQSPFAALAAKNQASGKASGFGSFGAGNGSSGFGTIQPPSSGTGFGSAGSAPPKVSGFGSFSAASSASQSPFALLASSYSQSQSTGFGTQSQGSGFGSQNQEMSLDGQSQTVESDSQWAVSQMDSEATQQEAEEDDGAGENTLEDDNISVEGPNEVSNGEEGEKMVMQFRAKLFKLGEGQQWVEKGIGPLRLLEPAPSASEKLIPRIVMRRETHPGGHGTKLILNVGLGPHVNISVQGERACRISCIEASESDGEPVIATYLVRVEKGVNVGQFVESVQKRVQTRE